MSIRHNYMKSNRKPSNSNKSKRIIALVIVLVLAAGAATYFFFIRDNNDDAKKTSNSRNISEDKTHDSQSEGSTFPVPDNVPKDAIKDYALITENEEYKIRKDKDTDSYLITLYAIINRPDQYDMYKEQLAEYKQKALQYLKDKGVDVTKVEIVYEPSEAKDL